MKNKKKIIKFVAFAILIVAVCALDIVYAETVATIEFCNYGGVRKTLKILGIILTVVKIAIPMVLILTGIATFFKTVTSGKEDDLKAAALQFFKKMIAGLVIFVLPGLMDYIFDNFVDSNKSSFTQCTNCFLDTGSCDVNVADPKTTK
jgi:hypothetical protein